MKTKGLFFMIVAMVVSLTFFGCGGGGGGSGSSSSGKSGVSKGVITALGSIWVNDVEFKTDDATVYINGQLATKDDLKVGMVVTVHGSFDEGTNGTAYEVDYEDNLSGPVDITPDLVNNNLQILGQTVHVDTDPLHASPPRTIFVNFTSLDQLSADSVVEVCGLPDANGVIQATYIELKSPTLSPLANIEIKGTVKTGSLNTTDKTFKIGLLTVSYTSVEDLPEGLAEGIMVEVKGHGSGYTGGASPTLIATEIELNHDQNQDYENEDDGDAGQIEGFISGFTFGSGIFYINGVQVNAGALSLLGIFNNVWVEVEGSFSNGIIIASGIKIKFGEDGEDTGGEEEIH